MTTTAVTTRSLTGVVEAVEVRTVGALLVVDAAAAATSLTVDDNIAFPPGTPIVATRADGTTVTGLVSSIAAPAGDTTTISLAAAIGGTLLAGETIVAPDPIQQLVLAQVETDPGGEPLQCTVPHTLQDALRPGLRRLEDRERVLVGRDDLGKMVVRDVVARPTSRDLGLAIAVPDPVDVAVDPPATSPALTVTGTPSALVVRAEAVDPSAEIAYYLSTDPTFAPTPASLSVITRATVYVVDRLPDGTPLSLGTTYYVRAIASNAAGTAPASAVAAGQLNTDNISTVVAAELVAGFVLAGKIQVGNITIDPAEGIVIPQSTGGSTYLRADGAGNRFAGQAELSIANVLEKLMVAKAAWISQGFDDPAVAPQGRSTYDLTPVDQGGLAFYGLVADNDGTSWLSARQAANGQTSQIIQISRTTGAITMVVEVPHKVYGVAPVSGSQDLWVLTAVANTGGTYTGHMRRLTRAGAPVVNAELVTADTAYTPGIGVTATRLLVAYQQGSRVRLWSRPLDGTGDRTDVQFNGSRTGPTKGIVPHPTIANTYWLCAGSGITQISTVSSQIIPRAFPKAEGNASQLALGYAGTTYYSLGAAGISAYTALEGEHDFAFTWIRRNSQGALIAETIASPSIRATLLTRARWTIDLPSAPPAGASGARIYVAAAGQALQLQGETGPTDTSFHLRQKAAGANPPTSSNFAGVDGAPPPGYAATVGKDAWGPNVLIRGDGAYRLNRSKNLENTGLLTVTLLNGWQYFGGDHPEPTYELFEGMIWLRGFVKNGSVGSPMFTLRVGHRPAVRRMFNVYTSGGAGRLDVYPSGAVTLEAGSTGFVSIDDVHFRPGI